jgi:hypothetical protein
MEATINTMAPAESRLPRAPIHPADCRETLSTVTLPFLETQIEALTERILAILPQETVERENRDFALRCLGEAYEEFPEDLDLGEMVIRRAAALGGLDLCARMLKA